MTVSYLRSYEDTAAAYMCLSLAAFCDERSCSMQSLNAGNHIVGDAISRKHETHMSECKRTGCASSDLRMNML
jgi:hypothetical protein